MVLCTLMQQQDNGVLLMTKWQEVKLGDICLIIDGDRGKNYPRENEFSRDGYCLFLNTKNVPNIKFDFSECVFISKDKDALLRKGKLKFEDIVVTTRGTLANFAYYTRECIYSNIRINSGMVILRNENQNLYTPYLYHFLMSKNFKQQVSSFATGSAQPQLPIKDMKNILISLPPFEVQKEIAGVLSALDDKIELNNKINNNLEQQAQALFKSWFVDFEPFGGVMPEDWKVGKLGDFIEIKRGGSPRPIQEYLAPSGLNWLKISDATAETSPYILEIKEHIKPEGLNKTVFLKKGSLVLSNSATPGIPKFLDIDTCIHDGWLYFPSSLFSNEYLFLLFNHIRKDLISLGNGSVFTNLKTDILRNFEAILPTKEVLQRFDSIVSSIFISIKHNREEIATLTTLRDALLPKLMSGEIDVSNVDISALTSTDKLSFKKD